MMEFFTTIGDFISMIVDGIKNFLDIVGSGISFITSFLGFFPPALSALLISALVIMIAIGVIKLI